MTEDHKQEEGQRGSSRYPFGKRQLLLAIFHSDLKVQGRDPDKPALHGVPSLLLSRRILRLVRRDYVVQLLVENYTIYYYYSFWDGELKLHVTSTRVT